MYEDIYNKIIEYLKENSGVFHSIVTTNAIPTYFDVQVDNHNIYISTPENTPNPTTVNAKLSKNEFFKIYPLYLEYLKVQQDTYKINKDVFNELNKKATAISGKRIYWIGLFFELKKRNII